MTYVGLPTVFNFTWKKTQNEKFFRASNNDYNGLSSDTILSKDRWIMHQFTVAQRTIFILSLIILFWIILITIYTLSRILIRLFSSFKRFRFKYDSPRASNEKICRAFVISSNQYGSFRPTYLPSSLLYRSDSLFSNCDFVLTNQEALHQTDSQPNENTNNSLLEYYLKTYNPLKIDLTDKNQDITTTSIIQDQIFEEAPSDTDTRPIDNCYSLSCSSKRKIYNGRNYTRLKESENCSVTMSTGDDQLSECSTKLTSVGLPTLMITDCSNTHRPHTDIIELDEDENEKQ